MVVGDAKPFIAALVTLDEEALPGWAAANGKEGMSNEELHPMWTSSPRSRSRLPTQTRRCRRQSRSGRSASFPTDLTIEGGELTPTLKVKRSVVASKYASTISDIYG